MIPIARMIRKSAGFVAPKKASLKTTQRKFIHQHGLFLHVTIIVSGGSIVALGTNEKSGTRRGIHSEVRAIRKLLKKIHVGRVRNSSFTLYNLAFSPISSAPRMAKPCRECSEYILKCGLKIKQVCWSVDDSFEFRSPRDLLFDAEYSSGKPFYE